MGEELLWIEFGKIHLKLGALEDAVTAFSRAIEINPTSGWAYCNLASAYQQKAEYGKAVSLYLKSIPFLDDAHTQTLVWNRLGDTYRELKDTEKSMAAYEKAISFEMCAVLPLKNPDTAWKQMSSAPDQRPFLDDPIKVEPKPAPALEKIKIETSDALTAPGSCTPLDTDNKIEQAIDRLSLPAQDPGGTKSESTQPSRVQEGIKPAHLENQLNRSSMPAGLDQDPTANARVLEPNENKQSHKEKNDPALEDILSKIHIYENITRSNPMNDRAWDTLGKLYKSLGRFPDAIAAYQQAIKIAPTKDVYYYYLGLLYAVGKQDDLAIQAFQDVLRLNPEYVLAHSAIAGIYQRIGMEAKANQHISIAMPKITNESTYNQACFYSICGDHERSLEFLDLALKNKDISLEWILSDPDLDSIRGDQRFQALIEETKTEEKAKKNLFSANTMKEKNSFLNLLNSSMAR